MRRIPTKSARKGAAVLLVASVAWSLAACGAKTPDQPRPPTEFAAKVTRELEEAHKQGASANQLAELESVARDLQVDVETARAAMHRTVECIVNAGYEADYMEEVMDGVTIRPYLTYYDTGTGNADAVYDECSRRESYWIEYLYETQPSTIDAQNKYLEQQLPTVIACLERNGVSTDPEEDMYVTLDAAVKLMQQSGGEADCLAEAEITGY